MKLITTHIENYPFFKWGKSDCVKFVADFIGIETPHTNKKEAIKLIRDAGSFESLIDQYLNRKELSKCSRGDIVMVSGSHGKALGICDGEHILCNSYDGVVRTSMSNAIYSWSGKCQQ